MRTPITKTMDMVETVHLMAQGHDPTKKLLMMCVDIDRMMLLHLDDMNLRGPQIWAAYYGYCEGWFDRFRVCVTTRSLEMVGYVNKNCPGPRAVPRGGAPR